MLSATSAAFSVVNPYSRIRHSLGMTQVFKCLKEPNPEDNTGRCTMQKMIAAIFRLADQFTSSSQRPRDRKTLHDVSDQRL